MRTIPSSELIINGDGSIFHLHLKPEQLADIVMLVGDPARVAMIAEYFDTKECEDAGVNDVYDETECENRNHDVNHWSCHEPASACVPSLSCRSAPSSFEHVNNSEEVDYRVKKHEENKEKSTYAHDKLLGN